MLFCDFGLENANKFCPEIFGSRGPEIGLAKSFQTILQNFDQPTVLF